MFLVDIVKKFFTSENSHEYRHKELLEKLDNHDDDFRREARNRKTTVIISVLLIIGGTVFGVSFILLLSEMIFHRT